MTFIWFSCIIKIPKGDPPKEVFPMNKILLPVDGSKRSLRTVEMVQRLCDLSLIHI